MIMSRSKRLKNVPEKSRNFTGIIIIALKRNSTKNSSQTTSREKIGLKKLKFVQIPISHSTLEMLGKKSLLTPTRFFAPFTTPSWKKLPFYFV